MDKGQREFRKDARAKACSEATEKLTTALESDDAAAAAALSKKARIVSLKAKNSQSVSASYDGRSRRSDAKQRKLEGEREAVPYTRPTLPTTPYVEDEFDSASAHIKVKDWQAHTRRHACTSPDDYHPEMTQHARAGLQS